MVQGDKNALLGFACCLVVLLVLNAVFWSNFASGVEFQQEQVPGHCLDGRLISESLLDATGLSVDDTKRYKNNVNMHCAFRVAFYPCLDEDADSCLNGNFAAAPVLQDNRAQWPLREADEAGLTCAGAGLTTSDRCSEQNWDCSGIGRCDAYQKSVRMCASKFKTQPYTCFGMPDKPEAGVRIEAGGFPVGWLIGGILSAITTLLFCVLSVVALKDEENLCLKLFFQLALWAVCFGIIMGIVFIIRALTGGVDEIKGSWSVSYADLAITRGNETAFLPVEEPPEEGFPAWAIVLIVVGSIIGCGCFCFGCMAMLDGMEGREKAAAVDTSASSGDSTETSKEESKSLAGSAQRHKARLARSKSTVGQYSKEDLNALVKQNSANLSNRQIVGHHVLNVAEDHLDAIQRVHSKTHALVAISKVVKQSSEPPVGFARCTKEVVLQKGDVLMVDSNRDSVQQLCEKEGTIWTDEKAKYLGQEGVFHGKDWMGPGRRVLFPDGHWWSYHPDSLYVKLEPLDAARKALLSSDGQEASVIGQDRLP